MFSEKVGCECDNWIDLARHRLRRSDEMIHHEIRALYSYWEELRGGRTCPDRTEVDPRDLATDARHLFVLEDLGQDNIRFRLAGTGLLEAFGFDLRGMSARAIMSGKSRESFVALITETIAEPGVGYARLTAPDGESVWEVVLLPLRGNFGTIDRVIGCLHPVAAEASELGPVPLRFAIDSMSIQPVGSAGRPQAETPDSETPDSETPDSETPEGETPEGETPGGRDPGGRAPRARGGLRRGPDPLRPGAAPRPAQHQGRRPQVRAPRGRDPEAEDRQGQGLSRSPPDRQPASPTRASRGAGQNGVRAH